MPEKNPDLWSMLANVPPFVQGAILAFAIAVLRALYDSKEPRFMRVLLEGLICGGMTLACWGLNQWLGLPPSIGVFCGGTIGFLGVFQIRKSLLKFIGLQITK